MRHFLVFIFTVFLVLPLFGEEQNAAERYESAKKTMQDTVAGNAEMAKWCSENRLSDLAKFHWERILELDPDNAAARAGLGYVKDAKFGWLMRADKLEKRGLVKDGVKWKTRQEMQVEKILDAKKSAALQWKKKISKLRKALPDENAKNELLAINDPLAAAPLLDAAKGEKDQNKRILLIRAAANIENAQTVLFLVEQSMNPKESSEARNECVRQLHVVVKRNPDARALIVGAYSRYLKPENSPPVINDAGRILGALDCYEAIPRLIDAVVTAHKFLRTEPLQDQSFGSGNTSISRGERIVRDVQASRNQGVLSALQKLTNCDFQFDKKEWKNWYEEQQRSPDFNLRRI
ncbi:hypothetical protein FACS189419_07550 [Planctomycetales bacterium]|nr:hypothetical protein FACS189419_07550 [Planctomycetales bacterium]